MEQAGAKTGGEEGFGTEPVDGLAGDVDGVGEAAGKSGPCGADEDEDDGCDGQRAEGCEHGVRGAAGASETLMDERQAGDCERDEHDADEAEVDGHSGPLCRER